MNSNTKLILVSILVLSNASIGMADTITEHTGPIGGFFTPNVQAIGQSVTTSAGGPWNSIEFNYYNFLNAIQVGSQLAYGTLFLLTQPYSGLPSGLSNLTPGFVASTSTIVNGAWRFDSSVTLQANTQYFFFTNTNSTVPVVQSFGYPGGTVIRTFPGPNYTVEPFTDVAFSLRGSVASVPEPTSLLLLAQGLIGLMAARRPVTRA